MTPEECLLVRPEWALNPEQVEHFLRARRSIRSYKKEDVDRQLIDRLVRTARFAPSGHNAQPVRWTVWYRRKDVEHLAGLVIDWMRHLIAQGEPLAETLHMDRTVGFWEAGRDTICRGAPHMIVAHAPESERTAPPACTIALAYLELAAPSLGLGTCWAGYFTAAANLWPPMKAALELPEGHICFGAVMVGYPRYGYHRLPLRNEPPITWR
jgi:nitroreductase